MGRSRMLVAVSSPWASQKHAETIVDLARRLQADVVVAHVAQSREEDQQESDANQRGEQSLKLLTESLTKAGVTVEGVMLYSDDVPKALLNTAQARTCTLIVLGSTARSRFKRLFSSDVPTRIAHEDLIPVMILPANWTGTV